MENSNYNSLKLKVNTTNIVNSINQNLNRFGLSPSDRNPSGLQAIAADTSTLNNYEVILENDDVAIELYDNVRSGIYYGQFLSDILYIAKFASQSSPSKYWIWEVIEPALAEII